MASSTSYNKGGILELSSQIVVARNSVEVFIESEAKKHIRVRSKRYARVSAFY
jgi:hypothetical protein